MIKLIVYYAALSALYVVLYARHPESARALTIFFTSLLIVPAVAWEVLMIKESPRRRR